MKYFVTHGSGLDPFVRRELAGLYSADIFNLKLSLCESQFKGKLIFQAESSSIKDKDESICPDRLCCISDTLVGNLKTVERIFCYLCEKGQGEIIKCKNKHSLLNKIYEFSSANAESSAPLLKLLGNYMTSDQKSANQASGPKKLKVSHSFRVNVKISGKYKRLLAPKEVAACVGSALVKYLAPEGWTIDLKNPCLEIAFYLTDDGVLCGVPLTCHPLSERCYLTKIPLRSTVAFCMASLAVEGEPNESDQLLVLDPVCGSGTLLVELTKHFPQTLLAIGIDLAAEKLAEAQSNINKSSQSNRISVIRGDSTVVSPLRSDLIFDSVVCDLPFGIQHGSLSSVRNDLPLLLNRINSTVKRRGNIVMLISSYLSKFLEELCCDSSDEHVNWVLMDKYSLKLGELPAVIYHFRR